MLLSFGHCTGQLPLPDQPDHVICLPHLACHPLRCLGRPAWLPSSRACLLAECQVSGGISLPLEVFMTEDRGWGVRCATDIKAGQFVACYIGK